MLLKFATYTNSEQQLITTIRSYNWTKLKKFWTQIKRGNTPGWASGKALEYMVESRCGSAGFFEGSSNRTETERGSDTTGMQRHRRRKNSGSAAEQTADCGCI